MESILIESLTQELRRGTLTLCVLGALRQPLYGYLLQQQLADAGIEIEQNTLYPLLRRLEKQGLLDSSWNVEESRPRRYYVMNETGKNALTELSSVWAEMNRAVKAVIQEEPS